VYAPFARLCASRAGQEGNQAEAFQVTPEQMADHIERLVDAYGTASIGPNEWKVIIAALRAYRQPQEVDPTGPTVSAKDAIVTDAMKRSEKILDAFYRGEICYATALDHLESLGVDRTVAVEVLTDGGAYVDPDDQVVP
jgi:hypothetical protein